MHYVRVLLITVLVLCPAIQAFAATLTWDRNPEPNITNYIVSYGTQTNVHTNSIDVGNVTTYQFLPPPGQRYYIVVQARNSAGLIGPKSDEVMYDAQAAPNQAPTLTQPPNQSSLQQSSVTLALNANDPEGAPLSFSATGLPPGLSINSGTGVISGNVTTTGSFSVQATVSDGSLTASRTFTWVVTAPSGGGGGGTATLNLSPQDSTIVTDVFNYSTSGLLHTRSISNRVAYAAILKFDLSQLPANAVIQTATLQMYLERVDTVTASPNYNVSLHRIINRNPNITRVTGTTYDGSNRWTTNTCCTNNAPMAQSDISAASAVTNVTRTLGMKTWDALGIVRVWQSIPSSNYGMLLNPDTSVGGTRFRDFTSSEGTTAANRPVLRITYTTGGGGTPTDTTPPTVALSAPAANSTVSGTAVTVSATASDNSGIAGVQFRVDGVNIGAEDTTAPYSIVWNTTGIANGAHQLTAVARDTAGNSTTSAARVVTVNNQTNRPPVLAQPANQTSAEGASVSLVLTASDPDNNPLTYSATGLPPGLSIAASNGTISGTPSYTSAGNYNVTATVSDGTTTHSRTFSWTVTNTNRPPVLTQPPNQVSAPGSTVSLQLTGSDPDGSSVTYSATGLPGGLSVNTTTGLISGTLAASAAGVHDVTVRVSDGSLNASRTFTWSVDSSDQSVRGDFDGDGRNDLATYRASTGEWRVWASGSNFSAWTPIVWGVATDILVPADYDGDRRTDIAVFRPATGTWHVLLSSTNMQSSREFQWGDASSRPLAVDYDNDGRADLAVPRFGGFDILLSSSNYTTSVTVR